MNKVFSIMKRTPVWLGIALILMVAGILSFLNNPRRSIEFVGGISFTVDEIIDADALEDSVATAVESIGSPSYDFTSDIVDGEWTKWLLKIALDDDKVIKELTESLKQTLQSDGHITDESSLSSLSIIGPSIGDFMRRSAKRAIIVGLILMALYMMISFAGIRTVIPPYVLAIVTIVTMAFDVSIPAGAYGLLMQFNSTVQIDTVFIIAILTTMGYSINDTIIIFDRIRENIAKEEKSLLAGGALLGNVIETSLWQTMRRSLGTSISTLLVVVAMYFLGSWVIQTFAFTIGLGIVAGTFSSLFIAAPLMYLLMGKYGKERGKLT